jgi:hypothetical protein
MMMYSRERMPTYADHIERRAAQEAQELDNTRFEYELNLQSEMDQ